MPREEKASNKSVEIAAGLSAGFVTTIATHPLDLIKLRLQLDRAHHAGTFGNISRIMRELIRENTFNGRLEKLRLVESYYRGITPSIIGSTSAWGLYFMFYNEFKKVTSPFFQHHHQFSTSSSYMSSAFLAGWSTAVVTNPIWVIKTRILSTSKAAPGAYQSLADGMKRVWIQEGLLGFWKGLTPALLSVSQGALQFTLYDTSKDIILKERGTELSTVQYIYASAFSKMVSTLTFYPLQVFRSRLQGYDSIGRVLKMKEISHQLFSKDGIPGFYKGLVPNLMRVVPATCVTFVAYENFKKWFTMYTFR